MNSENAQEMIKGEKAQKHLERAEQLISTQFGTRRSVPRKNKHKQEKPRTNKHKQENPRTNKHKQEKRQPVIKTVDNVHALMEQELSKSTRRQIVIALLRNVKDDKMSNALVDLLKHQCSRIKSKEKCKAACKWSTPFLLSWLFSGSCSIDTKVNVITALGPKKMYIGAMFGIARVFQFLHTQIYKDDDEVYNKDNKDREIANEITSECIKFAQIHDHSIAIKAFQDVWKEIKKDIKDNGRVSGEMSSNVKLLYSSMYIYSELVEKLHRVISSYTDNTVLIHVSRFYGYFYEEWCGLNVLKRCIRAHILLVVALYFVPKAINELDIAAALFILEAIPVFVSVIRHQAYISEETKRDLEMARINGLHSRNSSFGMITDPTHTPVNDPEFVQPQSSVPSESNNSFIYHSFRKEQHIVRRLNSIPESVQNSVSIGTEYMKIMSHNSYWANRPIIQWPLLGTHNSVVDEGNVSLWTRVRNIAEASWKVCQTKTVMQQLSIGVRVLDVRPYLAGFNVDGSPIVSFHHGGFLYGSYDIHNFISDVLNFLSDHKTEVLIVYFGNTEYDKSLQKNPDLTPHQKEVVQNHVGALAEVISYFTNHIPKNMAITDPKTPYNELGDKQLLIYVETLEESEEYWPIMHAAPSCPVHSLNNEHALHRSVWNKKIDHPDEVEENMHVLYDKYSKEESPELQFYPSYPAVETILHQDNTLKWQSSVRPISLRQHNFEAAMSALYASAGNSRIGGTIMADFADEKMIFYIFAMSKELPDDEITDDSSNTNSLWPSAILGIAGALTAAHGVRRHRQNLGEML